MIEIKVMSQGRADLLAQLLQSLQAQKNSHPGLEIQVIQNESVVSREQEILNSKSEWILFLDEDCLLPDENYLDRLLRQIRQFPEVQVWGGLYLNQKTTPYRTKAYNELCNLWVLFSDQNQETKNLLGGCLALHIPSVKNLITVNPISWGGEDTYLLRELQKGGICCRYSKELSVYHQPPFQTAAILSRRAFLHGRNRSLYQLKTTSFSRNGFAHALRSFIYWPVWIFHFALVLVGSRAPTFAPAGKSSLLK